MRPRLCGTLKWLSEVFKARQSPSSLVVLHLVNIVGHLYDVECVEAGHAASD